MATGLTFVQGTNAQSAAGNPSLAYGSATTGGSFLLAWYINGGRTALTGTVPTDTLLNTWVALGTETLNQTGTVTNPNCMFFYCASNKAGGGANTVQFKTSAPQDDQGTLCVAEFTGQASSSPFDNSAALAYTLTQNTQQNLGTVTLANTNETIMCMMGLAFTGTFTAGTGYTVPSGNLAGTSGGGLQYGNFSSSPQTPTIANSTLTGKLVVSMTISVKSTTSASGGGGMSNAGLLKLLGVN